MSRLPTIKDLFEEGEIPPEEKFRPSNARAWLRLDSREYCVESDTLDVFLLLGRSRGDLPSSAHGRICDLQAGAEFSIDADTPVAEFLQSEIAEQHVDLEAECAGHSVAKPPNGEQHREHKNA